MVDVLNGLKQDNTVDLQLGHYIMIVTNPRWQLRYWHCGSIGPRLEFTTVSVWFSLLAAVEKRKKINPHQAFISLYLYLLIYCCSPASPARDDESSL